MKEMTNISFPGLGIEQFSLNKIAFSLGPIEVRWYGVFITLGIVLAFAYAAWRGKKNEGIIFDDVIDIGLFTVILGVIGARAYYVLTTVGTGEYDYSSFIKVIAVWEGGLAIYGGIIGGCLGIVIACLIKKIKWQRAFDMIGPGVMLAQAIGRWGNFFNGEAYGYSISAGTSYYFLNTEHVLESGEGTLFNLLRMGVSHNNNTIYRYYHPTFFYECVWNIIGFVLINLFYKRKKFDGQIALMYFVWYGFGRMFIEGFRSDSLYIPGTTLRISQCLGLACVIVGGTLLIVFSILAHKHPKPVLVAVSADGKMGEDLNKAVSVPTQTSDSNDETEDHTVDDLLNEMVETVIENIQNEEADADESAEPKEMEGEDALEPTKEEQNDGKID